MSLSLYPIVPLCGYPTIHINYELADLAGCILFIHSFIHSFHFDTLVDLLSNWRNSRGSGHYPPRLQFFPTTLEWGSIKTSGGPSSIQSLALNPFTLLYTPLAIMTTLSTPRGRGALAVSTVFTCFATLLVLVRIYTRAVMVKQMGSDDYAILIALVWTWDET